MRGVLPTTADVVIVGAGSAGCVIAERLSRDPARSVVLVERGPRAWPSATVRDLGGLPIESGADYAVDIEEMSGLGVVRGRGVGGSAAVNGGYFLRWHPDDFVGWPDDWGLEDIATSFDELDGPNGTMGVSAFADDELADVVEHFETYWAKELPVRAPRDAWPITGVNRVRSNRDGRLRRTSAEAYLRPVVDRPNLSVVTDAEVAELIVSGTRVDGVRIGDEALSTGEVVLSAGTLGTAAILLRSDLGALAGIRELPIHEHREILVHYRRRDVVAHRRTALLQSVVHTADDLEIRCYSADMANYVKGLPPAGPAIGVAVMRPGSAGSIRTGPSGTIVDLGSMDPASAHKAGRGVDAVATMLASNDFADIVEPGSIAVDPVVRTSQHAWGSMPMGKRTDSRGGVDGIAGLRIVDGSILPTAGRSGPHATIMMVAVRIADELIPTRRHGP
ncbi:mycofactocin system GMC family oxidoreductase MftG [Gordonia sp. LSe1-13]|uniref:Mycofactocin system GMC family oxidoreductase MftG n=1 Tax=Gordonia sesuvii TaxID=3116777 RepID=A0ABU7ME72_9ACTN|nr:mycofactocin system GMC family oxidoreductase MftG [Gordonia sp. LSe1-13]